MSIDPPGNGDPKHRSRYPRVKIKYILMFMKGGVRKARKLIAEIDRYFCFFHLSAARKGRGEGGALVGKLEEIALENLDV